MLTVSRPAGGLQLQIRRVKAQLELNLARGAKNNKKSFYRYVNQIRKVKESIPL